jgi:hypothetical protein
MQSSTTNSGPISTPSRKSRGTAFLALAVAGAFLLSVLWPAEGLASSASASGAQLVSLSHSVASAAKKKTGKKRSKKNKKKKQAKLCVKKKKVHGKKVPVYKTVRTFKRVKRGGKFVTVVTKRRVVVKVKCGKNSAGSQSLGVPVKITFNTGSYATLDFYQFTRQTPVTGSVSGYIPGSYVQGQANTVNITHGHIDVAQAPVFIDDVCNGQVSAAIKTGKQTYADIDQSKQSSTSISPSGSVQGNLNLTLHVNVELRHGDQGCNSPYLTTGYTTLPVKLRVFGKLNGFTTTLDTPDTILDDLGVCISVGADTQPCNGFEIPLPIGIATHVVGAVSIG